MHDIECNEVESNLLLILSCPKYYVAIKAFTTCVQDSIRQTWASIGSGHAYAKKNQNLPVKSDFSS